MVTLRRFRADDLEALYHICLLTGDSGQDASRLHNDAKLIGHIYAAPYGVVEPERVIVAEDAEGVAGYIVGSFDTAGFAQKLEQAWWPTLRDRYATADSLTTADRARVAAIMRPSQAPADLVAAYPAHVHMNLLPRLRGQRIGSALLAQWIAEARQAGVPGIHLGANTGNTGGVAFWQRSGFVPDRTLGTTVWFGMRLDPQV